MPSERDEETGRFTQEFSLSAFLDAVEELEPTTTTHVAEAVGCSYDLAYRRLKELEAAGAVVAMEVGHTFLWSGTR